MHQRWVRVGKVEEMEKKGWKVMKEQPAKLSVPERTGRGDRDIVLMEEVKEVKKVGKK